MKPVLKLVCDNPVFGKKTCNKCRELKDFSDFHKHSKTFDGLKSDCKLCRNATYTKKGYDSRRKIIEGGRICNSCNIGKTWDQFSKDKTGMNQKNSICISCRNEKSREAYKTNPKVSRQGLMQRPDKVMKQYGITISDVVRTLDEQHGLCANRACGIELRLHGGNGKNKAMIDHNHSTGKFRALLCLTCNVALGYLEKRENMMLGLQDYLTKHNSKGN